MRTNLVISFPSLHIKKNCIHLNNHAKQWWYFLVSTLAISTVIVSTRIRLPAFRCRCGTNGDDGGQRCYLTPARCISILYTIASLLRAVWSWHYGDVDEVDQGLWWYLRSWSTVVGSFCLTLGCQKNDDHNLSWLCPGVAAIVFSSGLFLQDCWSLWRRNHDEWWRWYHLRSYIAVLSPIEAYIPAISNFPYLSDDDNERRCFAVLAVSIVSIPGYFMLLS